MVFTVELFRGTIRGLRETVVFFSGRLTPAHDYIYMYVYMCIYIHMYIYIHVPIYPCISAELLKLERVRISSNPLLPFQSPPSPPSPPPIHSNPSSIQTSRHQASRPRPPESEILIYRGSSPLPQGISGCHRMPQGGTGCPTFSSQNHSNPWKSMRIHEHLKTNS